jgi:hypothetical protein
MEVDQSVVYSEFTLPLELLQLILAVRIFVEEARVHPARSSEKGRLAGLLKRRQMPPFSAAHLPLDH